MCNNLWLALHLWSAHISLVPNNDNFGIGIECDHFQIGEYRNSYDATSVYIVGGYDIGSKFQFGAFGGAVTGYNKPVIALGGFRAGYDFGKVRVQALLIPPVGGSPGLAHLMLEIPLCPC